MAQVEELRPRIARLRAAGKPVVAFMEYGGGRSALYLASACDRIVTTPEARFAALGLRIERRYYRRLLADLGARLDRSSIGAFKSAYRNYSVDSTTAADREAINDVLDTAQQLFVSAVAADRNITEKQLLTVLDGRAWQPAELVKLGVIDTVGYREDAFALAAKLARMGTRARGVSIGRVPESTPAWQVPKRIAVVYAAGGISEGRSGNDLLLGPYMGSSTMSQAIQSAFKNPEVEAVVLRVESPGGTDIASDLIHHSLEKAKKETKKPLIVSMGGVAASGGYHIALPGDRIYADKFTRTGSIGVYFLHPSLEGFYRKHDVRQDDFQRGDAMRAWSLARDWDSKMQAAADSAIRQSYDGFVGRVARDRNLDVNTVERSAQGRVWMGEAARERKLVDEIGGLEEAIAEARRRAGIPEGEKIEPIEYRRARPILLERLMGNWVRDLWERNMRLPEPGQTLLWADDLPPVE
jgi:protease-4